MQFEIVSKPTSGSALAFIVGGDLQLSQGAKAFESETGEYLDKALKKLNFKAEKNKTILVSAPIDHAAPALVITSTGDNLDDLDTLGAEYAAGYVYHAIKTTNLESVSLDVTGFSAELSARALMGFHLAAYRFETYMGDAKKNKGPKLAKVEVIVDDVAATQAAFRGLKPVIDAVLFARDLVSEPANILYPQSYADRIKALESLGLKIEVLGIAEMEKLGMGSLLGVGQGSARESKLVIMQWLGAADKQSAPIAFVGKGVTFDTGGISIKPADGMEDMKWDMGGSATVVGTMMALAGRKAQVNAVGVVGLVENMPDGNAQRPGDVVTSMSGQTIEVINTDAEGRLVLADALWYTKSRFKPQFMIDLATLTGAMIIALGLDYAGVFSNNDELADRILISSKKVGENTWRMPLPTQYEKQIDSKIADMKNIGGRSAGSITAALFLQKFVDGTPWAHLDIAPTAWTTEQRIPSVPEGGTGWGVRTLNTLVAHYYES